MRTLFTCVIFLFTASFCVSLTIQEKQNFVRTIYNRDAEIYSEFYLQEPVLPKQYANEPKRYSWWEVYVLEFNLDNNEQPDLIVGNIAVRDGEEPLFLYCLEYSNFLPHQEQQKASLVFYRYKAQ